MLVVAPYRITAFSLAFNMLLIEFLAFRWSGTFSDFNYLHTPFYVWTATGLSVLLAFLFGAASSLMIYAGQKNRFIQGLGRGLLGGMLAIASMGSPISSTGLLRWIGFDFGLAAFPLQGLDIKFLAILLLGSSIFSNARSLSRFESGGDQTNNEESTFLEIRKQILARRPKSAFLSMVVIATFFVLPLLPPHWKMDFSDPTARANFSTAVTGPETQTNALLEEINPLQGYTIPATYGDLGPQLLAAGAIDLERFVQTYENAGSPLSTAQLRILTEGSDEGVVIDQTNSYFLLNFFWALGLTNQNPLLDQGAMQEYSKGDIGRYASTGGWTIGVKEPSELYSSTRILQFTPAQQARLESVAAGVYRPCCNNPTSFPDCNHGMAMLGLLELMASQAATEAEMYEAAKYVNAFWFPQQALEVATFFQVTEGLSFAEVEGERVVASGMFSASGFNNVHSWLENKGLLGQAPSQGGSCGV